MAPTPSAVDCIEKTASGERRALARLCRQLDDAWTLPPAARSELLSALYAASLPKDTWWLGVTGSPGAGKSTLVSGLLHEFRKVGYRCGVLAIDPTSPYSGGALLGDRIRMQTHFADSEVFIRSLATRGAQGGLTRSTVDQLRALSLWGADVVLIETVGVGQDELDVAGVADTTCVVLAPGMGDDVQANKAGLLETADVFAVNKFDLNGAQRVVSDLEAMLGLGRISRAGGVVSPMGGGHSGAAGFGSVPAAGPGTAEGWEPKIVPCVALRGEGLLELKSALEQHRHWLLNTDAGRERRAARRLASARTRVLASVVCVLAEQHQETLGDVSSAVAEGKLDPESAALRLLAKL